MNNENLKQSIRDSIKKNENNEIEGDLLQGVLLSIVNQFGSGSVYAGFAVPSTNPTNTDVNMFYLAKEPGLYVNFAGYTLEDGKIALFDNKSGIWNASEFIEVNSISSIEKTGTSGLVDTYTITFTDNTTFEYDVTNGGGKADTLFDENNIDTGVKQYTSLTPIQNGSVSSVHGLSASIGIVPNKFNSVKVYFAQDITKPITQIEIRLFQGKTAGGTPIIVKRQAVNSGNTVQTSVTVNFDSVIGYSGEMWVQILMNNPFAYKFRSSGSVRTSANGYGIPSITNVNDLNGTSFPTAQGQNDLYIEFNTIEKVIQANSEGDRVIIESFTEVKAIDITGDFTAANSYLANDGTVVASVNWRTTERIPVKYGKTYHYQGRTNQTSTPVSVVGYDSLNNAFVLVGNSDHSSAPFLFVVPENVVSIAACGFMDTPPVITVTEPKIFEDLIPEIKQSSKIKIPYTWHCIGHSIWANDGITLSDGSMGVGIQTLMKRIFSFAKYNRYCYSGRSLGATAPTGDVNSITNYFNTWTDTSSGFWTLDTITNDFRRNIPIGTISDYTNNTGVMTYYGALRALKEKIFSLTPGTKMIASNALRRDNGGYTSTSTNTVGHTLADYEKAIMTICQLNGWFFVDQFRQSEITDETLSITTLDGLHPNNFGYTLISKLWSEVLKFYLFI